MLRSLVQRVYWPLGLAAALGLVFVVSSAEAVNKNPGDPFSLGIVNSIDHPTELSGNARDYSLRVFNTSPYSRAIQAESVGVGNGEYTVGVYGQGTDIGVNGISSGGAGVRGFADGGNGVEGLSIERSGVFGRHTDPGGVAAGVEGDTASRADRAVGVLGKVTSILPGSYSAAVRGINRGVDGRGIGVYGSHDGSGWGVFGTSAGGVGVYALAPGGLGLVASGLNAAHFYGNVHTFGLLTADRFFVRGVAEVGGDLVVHGGKYFRIDDPLDPKHKYLLHAAIESNQVLNIYSGNITTDQQGTATVRLPAYFDRINTDVRYQLTVVGQFAQAIIAKKEARNRFVIRTDKPRVEVSWQVTARRNDAYMRAHPFHEIQKKTKAKNDLTAQRRGKPPSQVAP